MSDYATAQYAVDEINSELNDSTYGLAAIKNAITSSAGGSEGTKDLKVIAIVYSNSSYAPSTLTTVVNISGKGKLYDTVFANYKSSQSGTSTYYNQMKVTVDNNIIYNVKINEMPASGSKGYNHKIINISNSSVVGINNESQILGFSSTERTIGATIAATYSPAMIINDYIPFNSSLKIEIKGATPTDGSNNSFYARYSLDT